MTNDFYTFRNEIEANTVALSKRMNTRFRNVEQGFNKIPSIELLAGGHIDFGVEKSDSPANTYEITKLYAPVRYQTSHPYDKALMSAQDPLNDGEYKFIADGEDGVFDWDILTAQPTTATHINKIKLSLIDADGNDVSSFVETLRVGDFIAWQEAEDKWLAFVVDTIPVISNVCEIGVSLDSYSEISDDDDLTGATNEILFLYSRAVDEGSNVGRPGYEEGYRVTWLAKNGNTGAATINVNGLGSQRLRRLNGAALTNNTIVAGRFVEAVYDGTDFRVINLPGSATTSIDNNDIRNAINARIVDTDIELDGTETSTTDAASRRALSDAFSRVAVQRGQRGPAGRTILPQIAAGTNSLIDTVIPANSERALRYGTFDSQYADFFGDTNTAVQGASIGTNDGEFKFTADSEMVVADIIPSQIGAGDRVKLQRKRDTDAGWTLHWEWVASGSAISGADQFGGLVLPVADASGELWTYRVVYVNASATDAKTESVSIALTLYGEGVNPSWTS